METGDEEKIIELTLPQRTLQQNSVTLNYCIGKALEIGSKNIWNYNEFIRKNFNKIICEAIKRCIKDNDYTSENVIGTEMSYEYIKTGYLNTEYSVLVNDLMGTRESYIHFCKNFELWFDIFIQYFSSILGISNQFDIIQIDLNIWYIDFHPI